MTITKEMREALRGMGYDLRVSKEGYTVILDGQKIEHVFDPTNTFDTGPIRKLINKRTKAGWEAVYKHFIGTGIDP